MLPRSTACRHGDGRTCTKNASTSSTVPSRTMRLPGLMSRWASPAFHIFRISSRPSSMIWSSTSASLISTAPSKNSIDDQVLALRRDLGDPVRRRDRELMSCMSRSV